MKQKGRKKQKLKNRIIIGTAAVVIIVVAIIAYVHFSSTTNGSPSPTPSPTSSPAPTDAPVSWPNATLAIDPVNLQLQSASIGQTIEVNLTVTNVHDLWGWDISYLTFNSAVLNLTQVTEGPFLKSGGQTFFISTADVPMVQQGTLPSVAEDFPENTTVSGSGTLATLTFHVLSAGTSPIKISSANLYNQYVSNDTAYQEGLHEAINTTIVNGNIVIDTITS